MESEGKDCSFPMSRAMTRKYVLRPFPDRLCILFALLMSKSKVPNKICARELGALSSSFAWLNGIPLYAIISSGYWRSENSFIRFYLRDMAGNNEKLFSLGPVVVSHIIISYP